MKKVIMLSDMEQVPKGVLDLACMLNEQEPILLTGVFLARTTYLDILLYYSGGAAAPVMTGLPEPEEAHGEEAAIGVFERFCLKNGIEYRTHKLKGNHTAADLRKETRFADLLLFSKVADPALQEHELTGDVIRYSECPVIIVPETFCKPENLILAYDGSASSVFAIRQFAALFPKMCPLDTLLFYMHADSETDLPDQSYIEELAACHFPNITFFKMGIDPRKHFAPWLRDQQKTLLVTGAFGRSALSQVFRQSFIGEILRVQQMPVFIAHK